MTTHELLGHNSNFSRFRPIPFPRWAGASGPCNATRQPLERRAHTDGAGSVSATRRSTTASAATCSTRWTAACHAATFKRLASACRVSVRRGLRTARDTLVQTTDRGRCRPRTRAALQPARCSAPGSVPGPRPRPLVRTVRVTQRARLMRGGWRCRHSRVVDRSRGHARRARPYYPTAR